MRYEAVSEEEYYDSLELMACIVSAEAENQSFEGKCLVADVILNRAESELFPDKIEDVIAQNGQFSTYASGAYLLVDPSEETYRACKQELEHRGNEYVLFFRSTSAWNWEFKQGDHYFK